MRRLVVAIIVLVLAVSGVIIARGAAPKPNNVSGFMQLKLDHSKKVLEGIVKEDFDAVSKHSQQLGLLSEDSSWQVFDTPDYVRHSAEFRRTTEALTAAAKEKNIDGAALAYMDLTLKCVNCHKYVRDVRMARGEVPMLRLDRVELARGR
jgi:hypothetical protein